MKPESERNQTLRRPSTETSLVEEMLTAKEVATEMKISTSWLAKRRMDGDGPPYIKVGRSIPLHANRDNAMDEIPAAHVDECQPRFE
jgi:hypothetical protein